MKTSSMCTCRTAAKVETGKVKHCRVHCLTRRWDSSTLDTRARWGTIMKHHAIKGVPDRLNRVWWASVSLQSSRTPQLINHQGGAWGARSLKPLHHHIEREAITSPFPCTVYPAQPPPPTLKSRCTDDQGSIEWKQRLMLGAIKWSVEREKKEKQEKKNFLDYANGLFKAFNIFK